MKKNLFGLLGLTLVASNVFAANPEEIPAVEAPVAVVAPQQEAVAVAASPVAPEVTPATTAKAKRSLLKRVWDTVWTERAKTIRAIEIIILCYALFKVVPLIPGPGNKPLWRVLTLELEKMLGLGKYSFSSRMDAAAGRTFTRGMSA